MQIQAHEQDGGHFVVATVSNVERGVWWMELSGSLYSVAGRTGERAGTKRDAVKLAKTELKQMLIQAAYANQELANRFLAGSSGRAKFEEKAKFYLAQLA